MNVKVLLVFFVLILTSFWVGNFIANSDSKYALTLVGGGLFILLSFFRPDIGLLITIISTLLLPGMQLGEAGAADTYYLGRKVVLRYEDIIILMLFSGWWAQSTVRKIFGLESKVIRLPFTTAIFIFIGVAVLATVLGIGQGTTTLTRGGLFFFKRLEYFLVFFMTYRILSSERDILFFLKVFLILSFIVMVVGLVQFAATGGGLVYSTFTEVGANPLASFCLLLLPFSLNFFLKASTTTERFIMGVFFVVVLLNFIFTRSRGGYIAFLFTAFIFFVTTKKFQWILPVFILIGSLYFFLPKGVQKEFQSLKGAMPTQEIDPAQMRQYLSLMSSQDFSRLVSQSGVDASWGARLNAIAVTAPLVMKNPFFGAGLGSVDLAFVDNQYVLDLVSIGAVGLIAFLFLLYKVYRFVYSMARLTRDRNLWIASTALGMYSGFVGLLVHGLTVTNFYTIRTMVPFWFLMGILAVVYRLLKTEEEEMGVMNAA